ncbi:MAG: RNA methyltransferase [Desulfovibrio sp.]|nr:RNA methyltransferase [Desulfovibrio sp.]
MENHENDTDLMLPGMKPVLELLASAPQKIEQVLCSRALSGQDVQRVQRLCQENGLRFTRVGNAALDRLCRRKQGQTIAHQGIAARLCATTFTRLEDILATIGDAPLQLLLALDQVQDPGNAGTLIRSLYALGGAGLILPEHNTARLGPAARRTAAGALERLPIARVKNLGHALDACEEAGLAIYGAAGDVKDAVNAFSEPMRLPAVLVLGNEAKGLRPGTAKRCSRMLAIPLARDFDSLNVAQAGAMLMALAAAARAKSGEG